MFIGTYCPRLSSVVWYDAAIDVDVMYVHVWVIYLVMEWIDGCRVYV